MEQSTYQLGQNTIQVKNTFFGKERVYVNDKLVSTQFSMDGGVHQFTINDGEAVSECILKVAYGNKGLGFDLTQDGAPVLQMEKTENRYFILLVLLAIFTCLMSH